jgi:hypothetical protein
MLRTAATAAAAFVLSASFGGGAHAGAIPEEPSKLHLKGFGDIPLAEVDGVLRLTEDFDLWRLVAVESLQDFGEYQIIHDESGQCLTADTSEESAAADTETAPVSLVDCADAAAWQVGFDDAASKSDFRFETAEGYFLGVEYGTDPAEGVEVSAVEPRGAKSKHFQEWMFAAPPVETPSSPAPTTPPASESEPEPEPETESESESESPKASLPVTGTALGAGIGGGVVALLGGTALVLWWQRRRALRSEW